jgi:hypothetical protein
MVRTIYDLKLGEEMGLLFWSVTRVPGGWIFLGGINTSCCFVPFDNEFQNGEGKDGGG